MTTVQASSKQNGIESGGPIRFSSRLKEGRALAQDVWSIYKSVLRRARAAPANGIPVTHCVLSVAVPRIFHRIASISVRGI